MPDKQEVGQSADRKDHYSVNRGKFKDEMESYLEEFGGSYQPNFGYDKPMEYQRRNNWGSILDYVWGDSKDEKVSSVIKTMKGRKEIQEIIAKNQFKDMIAENENILKSYIVEKAVLPKLKNNVQDRRQSRGSVFRIDTLGAVNNLIHQKTFINEIKNEYGTY